MASMLYVLIT